MTFAEYNTDENFDNDKSSLDELVKIGLEEGKTSDEIKNSLSPKWQKSKKIGEFDNYVSKYSAPKEEPKKEEVTEKVIEQTAPKEEAPKVKTSTLDANEKAYIKKQDEIADTALNTTLNDVENRRKYNWEQQYETGKKAGEAFSRIDDKLVEQLPTFMFKRYQNGEFGDPKSSDAKLRLAHFMINGVQSRLKNASNAFNVAAGRSPLFADTTSDYEKYQQSNLAKGLENRWRKYEAETENAIQLAAKESMTEQEARLEAEKIANDKKMATKWNMMDARQKVDLMQIKKEIGKLVGKMDLSEIADFMTGEAISGDLSKDEAVAIGVAQLVKNSPELLRKLPEGDMKTAILGLFGGGSVDEIISSLNGESDTDNGTDNDTVSATAVKLSDGTVLDPGKWMSKNDYSEIDKAATRLSDRYYRGEITEEEFRDDYNKLYNVVQQHNIMNKVTGTLKPVDRRVKELKQDRLDYWNRQIDDLNSQAKNGQIKTSDYSEKFAEYEKALISAGGDAKKVAKKKLSTQDILNAVDKINKAKSKKK